jgi:hypothetical protein
VRGEHVLTKRVGSKVQRERFEALGPALHAIQAWLADVSEHADRRPVTVLSRDFAPVQQVVGRAELRGPGRLRGGVDVRGDGSAEAWTGRWGKRLVEQRAGEDAGAALARVLAG